MRCYKLCHKIFKGQYIDFCFTVCHSERSEESPFAGASSDGDPSLSRRMTVRAGMETRPYGLAHYRWGCAKSNRARAIRESPLQGLCIPIGFLQKFDHARADEGIRPYGVVHHRWVCVKTVLGAPRCGCPVDTSKRSLEAPTEPAGENVAPYGIVHHRCAC